MHTMESAGLGSETRLLPLALFPSMSFRWLGQFLSQFGCDCAHVLPQGQGTERRQRHQSYALRPQQIRHERLPAVSQGTVGKADDGIETVLTEAPTGHGQQIVVVTGQRWKCGLFGSDLPLHRVVVGATGLGEVVGDPVRDLGRGARVG
ncbi:hypothetical protein SZMC14600_16931 [Saccharomonospora azurea SZMC 14600]|nr:hypothetical protein SZMC14600_16931 [Saccharomonospora azurea SZMC 14600]